MRNDNAANDIAIIGMSTRFAGADSKEEYWSNLIGGIESITFMPDSMIAAERHLLDDPHYVAAAGLIRDYDHFDSGFFGIEARVADMMTPEHRIFLEAAHDVMVDGGYHPATMPEEVAVYAACNPQSVATYSPPPNWVTANDPVLEHSQAWCPDALAPYTMYHLGLKGEAMTVTAFCSSFHATVHLACQSLLLGQTDMAIAGGVMVRLPHHRGYLWSPGKPLSRDGHCRPFDAQGTGASIASGVAVLLLKPLSDALRDRDHIYATIKGTAINNNGAQSMGFSVLEPDRLAACIASALTVAGLEGADVSLLEAVGAGLPLFDSVEFQASKLAFGNAPAGRCSLTAVKGNVGHTGVASGGAGVVKAAMALKSGIIPGTLNHGRPGEDIDLARSPFFIDRETRDWEAPTGRRRAGINSIGGAGYNAHMILEEAPLGASRGACTEQPRLFVVSAHSEGSLRRQLGQLADRLEAQASLRPDDVAFTLGVGRRSHRHRWAAVASSIDELRAALRDPQPRIADAETSGGQELSGALMRKQDSIGLRNPAQRHERDVLEALAHAWRDGGSVDRAVFDEPQACRVPLASYSYERRYHWRKYPV
jgi:3-oxoacyl-[acyl-carrier-protein] synthase II